MPNKDCLEPDLLEALDYRSWLREIIGYRKKFSGLYTLRYVASRVGLDASTLAKVMGAQMHLHERHLKPLAEFFELGPVQVEYLEILFRFNKSRSAAESRRLYSQLVSYRNPQARQLLPAQVRYFEHWYHVAIREYLNVSPFAGDFRGLAKALCPSISVDEARNALEVLLSLGLVEKDAGGIYHSRDTFLSTGGQWSSTAISQFQLQLSEMAVQALTSIDKSERDISSLTLSMSEACFEAVKEKIAATRREIIEMVRQDGKSEAVIQFLFQAFPLSKWPNQGNAKERGKADV